MKSKWIIILTIFNFLIAGFIAIVFFFMLIKDTGPFTWVLPLPIGAFLAFTSGIFAIKRKSVRLGITGLIIAVATFLFYFILILLMFN